MSESRSPAFVDELLEIIPSGKSLSVVWCKELILGNEQYRKQMQGVRLSRSLRAHIAGVDLVRAGEGDFFVLEDNLRVPSGVSYMIENRKVMMRLFPELFSLNKVAPVEHYPNLLLKTLHSVSPEGVELVEGQDLFVKGDRLYSKTTSGPRRVDVIYRRVDDDYLDPSCFRSDSALGVPGLVELVQKGGVTLCNAIGTGIADDKAVYPFVPEMIRFYLGEEPLLQNGPTYLCRRKSLSLFWPTLKAWW